MGVSSKARETFTDVFANEAVPCILLTAEGRIEAVNDAFSALARVAEASLTGRRLQEVASGPQADDVSEQISRAIAGAGAPEPPSRAVIRLDGLGRPVDLNFLALRDADGAPGGVVAVAVDAAETAAAGDRPHEPAPRRHDATETEMLAHASIDASRIALWNTCPATGETWFNEIWYTLLDYEPYEFPPSFDAFLGLMHPEDHAPTIAAYLDLVEGRARDYRADFRLKARSGDWRWMGATGAMVTREKQGRTPIVCGTQVEITRRKGVEEALAQTARVATEHRQRLHLLAENSPAKLYEFRMNADGVVDFPYINDGVLYLLGVSAADVAADGAAIFKNIAPGYVERMNAAIEASRTMLTPFRFRYVVEHPDLGPIWLLANSMPQRAADGSTVWHGSVSDISADVAREVELRRARDEALEMRNNIQHQALHDALTGLPNRRYFDLRLKERRSGGTTLIRVDLDHFKYVNDTLGHAAGDALLTHVAELLQTSVRQRDFVARVGGDEFSIILGSGAGAAEAKALVDRIQARLARPFLFEGQVCRFGASFGIASRENDAVPDGELLAFADAALYRAKETGRNRVEIFTPELHASILSGRHLAGEIEEALDLGAFEPYFQPQICAATSELVGLEALARWRHPTRGLLAPDAFLEVAEQIRVVPLIDRMMFEKTVERAAAWRAEGFQPRRISFNMSTGRLHDEDVVRDVRRLQDFGVTVAFELLESVFVERESQSFQKNLQAIKAAGVEIEVDDFGSGHASIIGMLAVEPTILKIDRRLVSDVVGSRASRELIAAIVSMGRALNIRITAEGVETEAQDRILRALGCDMLQGYYFARPMHGDDVPSFAAGVNAATGGDRRVASGRHGL